MSDRIHTHCAVALLLAASAGSAYASGAQTGLEANGPVAITAASLTETDGSGANDSPEVDRVQPESPAGVLPQQTRMPARNESRGLGGLHQASSSISRSEKAGEESAAIQSPNPGSNEIIKVGGALSLVIGLLLLLRFVMKRAGGFLASGSRPSGVLEILARYPVGRSQQLILLKVARRIVLLHQSGAAMTALTEMSDPDEVAAMLTRLEAGSNQRNAVKFRKTFDEFMSQQTGSPKARPRNQRTTLPPSDAEIVDLTRTGFGFLSFFKSGCR